MAMNVSRTGLRERAQRLNLAALSTLKRAAGLAPGRTVFEKSHGVYAYAPTGLGYMCGISMAGKLVAGAMPLSGFVVAKEPGENQIMKDFKTYLGAEEKQSHLSLNINSCTVSAAAATILSLIVTSPVVSMLAITACVVSLVGIGHAMFSSSKAEKSKNESFQNLINLLKGIGPDERKAQIDSIRSLNEKAAEKIEKALNS